MPPDSCPGSSAKALGKGAEPNWFYMGLAGVDFDGAVWWVTAACCVVVVESKFKNKWCFVSGGVGAQRGCSWSM